MFFCKNRKTITIFIIFFVSFIGCYIHRFGFQFPEMDKHAGREIEFGSLSFSGTEKNEHSFRTISTDPQINGLVLEDGERNLCITMPKLPNSESVIQVFYSTDGNYTEKRSIQQKAVQGENIFVLPKGMKTIRIDIGQTENLTYQLESIFVSDHAFLTSYFIFKTTLFFLVLTFFLTVLFYCDKMYAFYKKHTFILNWASFCFLFYLIWSLVLPYNGGPDEFMRYDVVNYIVTYGRLPLGNDPILLKTNGWGTSYAFQPYLAYMIDAGISKVFYELGMRYTNLYHAARFGSVIYGTITVIFTYASTKKLFSEKTARFAAILLGVLPEFAFVCSYVNNDSLALMSVSMIVYAWVCGVKNRWSRTCCIGLGLSLSICFLSYKNSYGYILCSAIIFIVFYFYQSWEEKKKELLFEMIKKGLIICGIVAVFAGWWLVYKYFAYDGDITASAAREWAKDNYAFEEIKNHLSVSESGSSLFTMLFDMGFVKSTVMSFFAVFDSMSLGIPNWGYFLYVLLYLLGTVFSLCLLGKKIKKRERSFTDYLVYANLLLACIITISLSIHYSYNVDYQPQGRYILPVLLPLVMSVSLGIQTIGQKGMAFHKKLHYLPQILCGAYIAGSFLILAGIVIPHYLWK